MTDSSTGTSPGGRGFDLGPDTDELFGDIADESLEGAHRNDADDADGDDAADGGISDRTAADVFGQLRDDAGGYDADGVLADESPDEIIASADEPEPESQSSGDGASDLVDEDALEELLLTGRTKEQEFLWVDAGDVTDDSDDEASATDDEADGTALEVDEASATGAEAQETPPESDADDGDSSAGPVPATTEETALALREEETDLATTDDASSNGVLGWVRSVIGRLF